eukprot:543086-Pleurochrysis_carterae.AAC.2
MQASDGKSEGRALGQDILRAERDACLHRSADSADDEDADCGEAVHRYVERLAARRLHRQRRHRRRHGSLRRCVVRDPVERAEQVGDERLRRAVEHLRCPQPRRRSAAAKQLLGETHAGVYSCLRALEAVLVQDYNRTHLLASALLTGARVGALSLIFARACMIPAMNRSGGAMT